MPTNATSTNLCRLPALLDSVLDVNKFGILYHAFYSKVLYFVSILEPFLDFG